MRTAAMCVLVACNADVDARSDKGDTVLLLLLLHTIIEFSRRSTVEHQ